MRFGLNSFLTTSQFTDEEISLIPQFKSYGADVVELVVVEPSIITMSKLQETLKQHGMEQPITCGAFPPGRDLRGSEEEQTNSVNYIEELIDFARQVDSSVICGPMYSYVGRSNAHTPDERETQYEQIARHLKPLCKKAEDAGIALAFEPLNRFETDCINTIDQSLSLIERVGSPALKIHLDTFHMNIEENDTPASILKAGDHIGHFHASASHRGLIGEDQIDWDTVLQALKDTGYQGDIVMESFSEGNEVIARAAAIWRKLYESPEQYSVEGLKYLKEHWNALD